MKYNLVRLLQLSDPALPVGGFSHSAGLETYVQKGIVKDLHSAREFIIQQLTRNIFYTDAAFMSLAFDAATDLSLHRKVARAYYLFHNRGWPFQTCWKDEVRSHHRQ